MTEPTRRTTAKSNVVDFDKKRSKKHPRFDYKAFGREWKVKAPNQMAALQMFDSTDAEGMLKFITSFVVKEQRTDFIIAAADDEDFGVEDMTLMMEQLMEVTNPTVPT